MSSPSVVTDALAELFPDDPPRFMVRTPHGYHDIEVIRRDLASGGFTAPAGGRDGHEEESRPVVQ